MTDADREVTGIKAQVEALDARIDRLTTEAGRLDPSSQELAGLFLDPQDDPNVQIEAAKAEKARLAERLAELAPSSLVLLEEKFAANKRRLAEIDQKTMTPSDASRYADTVRSIEKEQEELTARIRTLREGEVAATVEQSPPTASAITTKVVIGATVAAAIVIGAVAFVITRNGAKDSPATAGPTVTSPAPSAGDDAPRVPSGPATPTTPPRNVTHDDMGAWLRAAAGLEGLTVTGPASSAIITDPGDPELSFDRPLLEANHFQAMAFQSLTRTSARPANPDLDLANYLNGVYLFASHDDAITFVDQYLERALSNGFSKTGTYGDGGIVLQDPTHVDLLFPAGPAIFRVNMGVNPGTPAGAAALDATDIADLAVAAGATP